MMDHQIHRDDQEQVGRLVDEIDETGVFDSDNIRRGWIMQLNSERVDRWKSIGSCHFPSCEEKSIPRSHSLSDSMMIDPISEDRYVMGPIVNTFDGRYEVARVAVRNASVFPGFCKRHEDAFVFEKAGQISSGTELQMQLFRAISRQVFFLRHERDSLTRYRDLMRTQFKKRIDDFCRNEVELKTPHTALLSYLETEFLGLVLLMGEQRERDLAFTLKHWYQPNAQCFGKGLPSTMHDELIACTDMLPLVFSGPIVMPRCQREPDGTPDFSKIMYVNVFPNSGSTLVHLVSFREQKEDLEILASKMEDRKFLLSSIRYWMLKCCDHWYMSPSSWEAIDAERKEEICQALHPLT